jgi:hypothetical protein
MLIFIYAHRCSVLWYCYRVIWFSDSYQYYRRLMRLCINVPWNWWHHSTKHWLHHKLIYSDTKYKKLSLQKRRHLISRLNVTDLEFCQNVVMHKIPCGDFEKLACRIQTKFVGGYILTETCAYVLNMLKLPFTAVVMVTWPLNIVH